MARDIFNSVFRKKDRILSTQDVSRLIKGAHELRSSTEAKHVAYKGLCQFVKSDGRVYIVPAKLDKKTGLPKEKYVSRHDKAKRYLFDHFGSKAHEIAYGKNKESQSRAAMAQSGISGLGNAFTLDEFFEAMRPVSTAEQCAWADKQSRTIIESAHQMDWRPAPTASNESGPVVHSKNPPISAGGSEEFTAANEWSLTFQDVCQDAVYQSPKAAEYLTEKFKKTAMFESFAHTKNDEPPRSMTLDSLHHELLFKPQERIDGVLAAWRDLAEITVFSDAQRDAKEMRISVELMSLIKHAIKHRTQMGNWLANKLGPHLPGRMGECAKGLGVSLVQLSLNDLKPSSDLMKLYQWAARNYEHAQNRMAIRKVENEALKLEKDADQLLALDDTGVPAAPAESPLNRFTPEQVDAAHTAYKGALSRADDKVRKIEDWVSWLNLPSYQGMPDVALNDRISAAWAEFAQANQLPANDPFGLILEDIPNELNDLWEEMYAQKKLTQASSGAVDASVYEAVMNNSARTMWLTSLYIKSVAAMGRILASEVPQGDWSSELQGDCIKCGVELLGVARELSQRAAPAMVEFEVAREQWRHAEQQLAQRQNQRKLLPEPRPYLGDARRKAVESEGKRSHSVPVQAKRRVTETFEAEWQGLLTDLEKGGTRTRRAVSQGSGGQPVREQRSLARRQQSEAREKKFDDAFGELKSLLPARETPEHVDTPRPDQGRPLKARRNRGAPATNPRGEQPATVAVTQATAPRRQSAPASPRSRTPVDSDKKVDEILGELQKPNDKSKKTPVVVPDAGPARPANELLDPLDQLLMLDALPSPRREQEPDAPTRVPVEQMTDEEWLDFVLGDASTSPMTALPQSKPGVDTSSPANRTQQIQLPIEPIRTVRRTPARDSEGHRLSHDRMSSGDARTVRDLLVPLRSDSSSDLDARLLAQSPDPSNVMLRGKPNADPRGARRPDVVDELGKMAPTPADAATVVNTARPLPKDVNMRRVRIGATRQPRSEDSPMQTTGSSGSVQDERSPQSDLGKDQFNASQTFVRVLHGFFRKCLTPVNGLDGLSKEQALVKAWWTASFPKESDFSYRSPEDFLDLLLKELPANLEGLRQNLKTLVSRRGETVEQWLEMEIKEAARQLEREYKRYFGLLKYVSQRLAQQPGFPHDGVPADFALATKAAGESLIRLNELLLVPQGPMALAQQFAQRMKAEAKERLASLK